MLRNIFIGILLCLCVGCSQKVDNSQVIRSIKTEKPYYGKSSPILRISAYSKHGSAIYTAHGTAFVTKYRDQIVIITARHVTEGCYAFRFFTSDRKPLEVIVKRLIVVSNLDAAIFKVSYISAQIDPMVVGKTKLGSACETHGFPENKGIKVYKGNVISAPVSTSADVFSGMSGGPVTTNGKVVGLISCQIIGAKNGPKSMLYRLEDIFDLLDLTYKNAP